MLVLLLFCLLLPPPYPILLGKGLQTPIILKANICMLPTAGGRREIESMMSSNTMEGLGGYDRRTTTSKRYTITRKI